MASQAVQVAWNKALISDALSSLWYELLVEITAADFVSMEQFYSLWPAREHLDPDVWGGIMAPLYTKLVTAKVLYSRLSSPSEAIWVDCQSGLFDSLLALPTGPSPPRPFKLQWMQMLMEEEMTRSLTRTASGRKGKSSAEESPKIVLQKVLRRVLSWVKIRGNLPVVLEKDQWPQLVSTPITILEQFQSVAEDIRRSGVDPAGLAKVHTMLSPKGSHFLTGAGSYARRCSRILQIEA